MFAIEMSGYGDRLYRVWIASKERIMKTGIDRENWEEWEFWIVRRWSFRER